MGRAQEVWGPDARRGDDDRVGPLSRSRNKAGGPQSLAPFENKQCQVYDVSLSVRQSSAALIGTA